MKSIIQIIIIAFVLCVVSAMLGGLLLSLVYNGFASAFGWPSVSYWTWVGVGGIISWIVGLNKTNIKAE